MSEETKKDTPAAPLTIHAKLLKARKEFHKTAIVKTGYNDFSNYAYFELSDFLVPAMEILGKHELLPVCSFETEIATMTVYDVVTGDTIVITSPLSTATLKACQPVQSMGACETFVRRYLWTAILEIVEHSAVDDLEGVEPIPEKGEPETPMAVMQQLATLSDFRTEHCTTMEENDYIDKQADMLTYRQADQLIARVTKRIAEKKGEK